MIARRSGAYSSSSAIGTSALTSVTAPRGSMPSGRPRRELRSPITSPTYSSGTVTVTVMIGSISVGWALSIASLNAIEPAILNAISDESTEWCWPSNTVTRTPRTGKPAIVPVRMASWTPFSTAGMKPPGITPPLIALTNSKSPSANGSISMWQSANWPRPPVCFL